MADSSAVMLIAADNTDHAPDLGELPILVPVAQAAALLGGIVTARTMTSWYDPENPASCPIKRLGRDFSVHRAWLVRQLTCDVDWLPPVADRAPRQPRAEVAA